jgi:hypothetical protein
MTINFRTAVHGARRGARIPSSVRRAAAVLIAVLALIACGPSVASASTMLTFNFDTQPLQGHPAGPFSLDFQFNDGSFPNDANNVVKLTLFDLGGGSLGSPPSSAGGVDGTLDSFVQFQDFSFLNRYTQVFFPGSKLSFGIDMTTFLNEGDTPDQFSFAILDSTGTEIPTQALGVLGTDVLVSIDIVPSLNADRALNAVSEPRVGFARIQVFATDPTRTPAAGGAPLDIAAPEVVIPEPATAVPVLTSLLLCFLFARHRRARTR